MAAKIEEAKQIGVSTASNEIDEANGTDEDHETTVIVSPDLTDDSNEISEADETDWANGTH